MRVLVQAASRPLKSFSNIEEAGASLGLSLKEAKAGSDRPDH
jgi:hypothetical protein